MIGLFVLSSQIGHFIVLPSSTSIYVWLKRRGYARNCGRARASRVGEQALRFGCNHACSHNTAPVVVVPPNQLPEQFGLLGSCRALGVELGAQRVNFAPWARRKRSAHNLAQG
jgi:hypothetical protein